MREQRSFLILAAGTGVSQRRLARLGIALPTMGYLTCAATCTERGCSTGRLHDGAPVCAPVVMCPRSRP